MRAYEKYKDSGYDWLGKIPAHWRCVKIREIFIERRNKVSDKDFPPLSVTKAGIVPQLETAAKSDDGDNRKRVNVGDFVINGRSDRKGSSGISPLEGSVSLINHVLIPRLGVNKAFLHYLLRSNFFIEEFYKNGRGIVADLWTTRYSDMKTIRLPLPPREEQDAIVRFLDAKCAKIDSFIKLKERQIALLNEKKQSIINQAVTRGLDPNAPMKDSGVDWIGKIPEGWEMKKVRRCFSSTLGKMLASEAKSPNDTFEKYFCAKDVHFSGIDSSDLKKMWFSEKEKIQFAVEKGDLLVVEGGAGAGGAAIFNEEGSYYIQNSIHRIRAKNGHDNNFLYYWLFALVNRKYIDFACNKATIPHFTGDKLKEMPFPVMPLEEERQICHYLNEKLQSFETIIRNIKREIDLLVEYRARFISDVVTGKINIL